MKTKAAQQGTVEHFRANPIKKMKSPVSERALVQRINRKLKPELQALKKTRSERVALDLGDYYLIDYQNNFVVQHHVNPIDLAKELKCIADWEVLRED